MPRVRVSLTNSNSIKIKQFFNDLVKKNPIFDSDDFRTEFNNFIIKEIKSLKDCSQDHIIEHYLIYASEILTDELPSERIYSIIKNKARSALLKTYTDKEYDNNIDIYFNDVKREYILHPQNESTDLEFLPENKDIFIKNNLKLVVSCAKKYRNLGLPFEDLIQAGNMGLLVAFDKFDTTRACLRQSIIDNIDSFPRQSFTYDEALNIISTAFKYNNLLNNTISKIPKTGFADKAEFVSWVKKNVKTAVFASVAFQWISAYIKQELDKYATIVKLQKDNNKEDEDGDPINTHSVSRSQIIYLDSINPYTDDNYTDDELADITLEEFAKEDESRTNAEREELYKAVLDKVFSGLSVMDARIIKKKFGIGFPYALSNQEIAENEGISNNEVKYSINKSIEYIKNSIPKETQDLIIEMMS